MTAQKNNIIIADSIIILEHIKSILQETQRDFTDCSIQYIVKREIKKSFPNFLLSESEKNMCSIDQLFDTMPVPFASFIEDYKLCSKISWFNELIKLLKDVTSNTILLEDSPEIDIELLKSISNVFIIKTEDILQKVEVNSLNFFDTISTEIEKIYETN